MTDWLLHKQSLGILSKWTPSNGYFSFLYKILEKHPWKSLFSVSSGWNSATCIRNSSFPEVLYKRSVLKNLSKLTDKHKNQSSRGVLWKGTMILKIFQNSRKNIFSRVSFLIKVQAGNLRPSEAATGDVL